MNILRMCKGHQHVSKYGIRDTLTHTLTDTHANTLTDTDKEMSVISNILQLCNLSTPSQSPFWLQEALLQIDKQC